MQAVSARQTRGVGRRSGGSAVEGGRGPGGGTPGSRGPSRVCQETCERREESRQPHGCAGSSPGGMSPSPARPGRRLNRCQQTLRGQNTGPRPRRWRSLHLLPPPYSPCQTAAPKHLPFRCVLGDVPRALCVCVGGVGVGTALGHDMMGTGLGMTGEPHCRAAGVGVLAGSVYIPSPTGLPKGTWCCPLITEERHPSLQHWELLGACRALNGSDPLPLEVAPSALEGQRWLMLPPGMRLSPEEACGAGLCPCGHVGGLFLQQNLAKCLSGMESLQPPLPHTHPGDPRDPSHPRAEGNEVGACRPGTSPPRWPGPSPACSRPHMEIPHTARSRLENHRRPRPGSPHLRCHEAPFSCLTSSLLIYKVTRCSV